MHAITQMHVVDGSVLKVYGRCMLSLIGYEYLEYEYPPASKMTEIPL